MDEQKVREIVRQELANFVGLDRYTVQKHMQLFDGRNIQTGRTTGTKIGTDTDQKVGFFGATPVIQQDAITAPSGGSTIDTQARSAVASIISVLEALGFTASS